MDTVTLESRKRDLLVAVIREYIKTAEPVGSVTLVEKYGFDLSPATIRNELAALEEEGLIEQPHTSAGRIPSERGFQVFVDRLVAERRAGTALPLRRRFQTPDAGAEPETTVKSVAKQVAEGANEAVIVAFGTHHVYYTGLSQLFSQPEFQEFGRVVRFSELIDRLDEVVGNVFPHVQEEVAVWLGRKNPFGAQCGTVIARCAIGGDTNGAMGILGPVRMDYERCVALLSGAQRMLAEIFSG